MRDIPVKVNGDTIQDFEWNPAQQELKDVVTDTGQTLNASDNYQVSKAMSIYTGSGDYYSDSGTANSYVISPIGNKQKPTAYVDGLRVRFIPTNNNTGSSQISISGLAAKNVKKGSFITSPSNLVAGDIDSNYITEAIFNVSLDCFILNPANYTQIVSIAQLPTGTISPMVYIPSNAPAGWIPMDDGTIGDASSGASNRANADCKNLFLALWNNVPDVNSPVSGGRGANALADWNAHKTIKLFTSTGRVFSNFMTGLNTGDLAGASSTSLGSQHNGAHNHTYQLSAPNSNGFSGINTLANYNVNGNIFNTSTSGSGSPFGLYQPTTWVRFFIKL